MAALTLHQPISLRGRGRFRKSCRRRRKAGHEKLFSQSDPVAGEFPSCFFLLFRCVCAAELPVVRIAHGAFNEKVAALWVAAEQGFYRKQGVNVEVINIRSGPQTMAAIASGDIQIAYTIPGSLLSAAAAGLDVVFFGGIVNRADGDFVLIA